MNRLLSPLIILFLVACSRHTLMTDGKLWSSMYQQQAAEYKALSLQAYNIARVRLDEAVADNHARPLAIITDIDETLLDNSPYAVTQASRGLDYDSTTWFAWTAKGVADSMPGAAAFFNYAASKHVEVFYISNRKEKERQGTLQNLQRYHLAYSDNEHLLLRQPGTSSSKESRRKMVSAKFDIVLLLGDNLADFTKAFDGKLSSEERASAVREASADFGKKFIVLPNANYGGWEDAVYGNRPLKIPQKDSAVKAVLKGVDAVVQ